MIDTVDGLIAVLRVLTDRQRLEFARWADAGVLLRNDGPHPTFLAGAEKEACTAFEHLGDGTLSLAEMRAQYQDPVEEAIWEESVHVVGAMVRALEDANQPSFATLKPAFLWLEEAAGPGTRLG